MTITYHGGNIIRGTAADRTGGTWTNLQSGYLFIESDTQLIYYWNGTAWAQSGAVPAGFEFVVYKSGSNYLAKRDGWSLESSNSAAETVIQYAIDNAGIGGTVALKGVGTSGYFTLTGPISLVNKNVTLTGFNINGNDKSAELLKGYATAEPLVNITNTAYTQNALQNITIKGNNVAGSTGVKWYIARGSIISNVTISNFDTGMEAHNWVNCDLYNLRIANCLTYGLYCRFVDARINTTRMFGGGIVSNPTDFYAEGSAVNSLQIFGTEFEGASSGYVHSVQIELGNQNILFIGCSFEVNTQTGVVSIYDNGNNNTYLKCEFNSDVSITPVQFRSSSKNNSLINCEFLFNTAATTQTVLVDSGAIGHIFMGNTKSTNTTGTVTLSDSGTLTTKLGNSRLGSTWIDNLPSPINLNGLIVSDVAKTANYTLTATDMVVRGDASGGAFTLTLPTAIGSKAVYTIIRTDILTSSNLLTIVTTSSQTINGAPSEFLSPGQSITLESDNANWQIIARSQQPNYFLKGSTANVKYIGGSIPPMSVSTITTTTAPALDTLWALPLIVSNTTKFDIITFRIITNATAGGVAMAGIYRDNGNCYPGALIFDTGSIDTTTGTNKDTTITAGLQVFPPGLYWLAWQCRVAAPQIRGIGIATGLNGILGQVSGLSSANSGYGYSVANAANALPDPYTAAATILTATPSATVPVPAIGLRPI